MDIQTIYADYLQSLTQLKDTSRPAIINLTTIAQECVEAAPGIVSAIVERCLMNPTSSGAGAIISHLDAMISIRTNLIGSSALHRENEEKMDALLKLRELVISGQIPTEQQAIIEKTVVQMAQEMFSNAPQFATSLTVAPNMFTMQASTGMAVVPGPSAGFGSENEGICLSSKRLGPPLDLSSHYGLDPHRSVGLLMSTPLASSNELPDAPMSILGAHDQEVQLPPRPVSYTCRHSSPTWNIPTDRLETTVRKILYPPDSSKCSQCGERFQFKNDAGRRLLDDHMDRHFRMNRKAREAAFSIQSRMWLSSEDDWIENKIGSRPDGPLFFRDSLSNIIQSSMDEKTAEVSCLPLPIDAKRKSAGVFCMICKDSIETGYDGDRDEWVVKGAVLQHSKYYHRKCLQDSLKSESFFHRGSSSPFDDEIDSKSKDSTAFSPKVSSKRVKK